VNKPIKIIFASFRDSMGMEGVKFSIDKHTPRLCSYPTLEYLIMPMARNLTPNNMERICHSVLDNNWELIKDFLDTMYNLGLYQVILCDWCTKEQISRGKFCAAGIIGRYIMDKADRDGEFSFKVEVEYRDGREAL
jgi:hypothetical protein